MSILLVGLSAPSNVRLTGIRRFRGTRWVSGEIGTAGDLDEEAFRGARIDCQMGAERKTGDECLDCPRLRGWREGPMPGQVSVCCGWGHFDELAARMTKAPALVSIAPGATCAEAERLAVKESVHHLLVVVDGNLVSVVCRCDLARSHAEDLVATVMSKELFAIDEAASLGEAAAAFVALNIGCLPVVRGQLLVGIITRGDLWRSGAPANVLV